MSQFETVHKLLQAGKTKEARTWLKENPDIKKDGHYHFLVAVTAEDEKLQRWEEAIVALEEEVHGDELLRARIEAAQHCHDGGDLIRERIHLRKSVLLSQELNKSAENLRLKATFANRLLEDGLTQEAQSILSAVTKEAMRVGDDLIVIAEGTILCGLLMNQKKWRECAALCVATEEASRRRGNWLGFAAGRMMRSSCWFSQGNRAKAIQLLFESGNILYEAGAVAALNLIKARLAEIRQITGEMIFEQLRHK